MVNASGNRMPRVSANECQDLDKIIGQQFTNKLVEDAIELRRWWSIVVAPIDEPLVTI